MPEESTELMEAQVRLRSNGDLYQRRDGTEVTIAHYDKGSGHLEFVTKEDSVKLYPQVTARLGTVSKGTQPSNNVIRSIGVKGEARPDLKKAPKKPKLGRLGDAAEEVVQWYLDHAMEEAIIRYGIYTDAKGQPIRKNVRRIVEEIIDMRDGEDEDLPEKKDGAKSFTKGPIYREKTTLDLKGQIIARRGTPLTFTPQEVVGGFQPDDDVEEVGASAEEDNE